MTEGLWFVLLSLGCARRSRGRSISNKEARANNPTNFSELSRTLKNDYVGRNPNTSGRNSISHASKILIKNTHTRDIPTSNLSIIATGFRLKV